MLSKYRSIALMMASLLAASFLVTSCGEDEDIENPKFIWTQPTNNGILAVTDNIIVDFTDNVGLASAAITVTSAAGDQVVSQTASFSGTSGTLTWNNDGMTLIDGSYTLSGTVTDAAGNVNTSSISFRVDDPNSADDGKNEDLLQFVGSPNSWGGVDMTFLGDHIWEVDSVEINSAVTAEWKFRNTTDWTDKDWGVSASQEGQVQPLAGTLTLKQVVKNGDEETIVAGEETKNVVMDNTVLTEGSNYYTVRFNDETFDYELIHNGPTANQGPAFTSVGMIGFALTGDDTGWEMDAVMTSGDLTNFRRAIYLHEGDIKFRADADWGINWGGTGFPAGTLVGGGDNIPVSPANTYYVTFEDGADYNFLTIDSIGIIGSATPTGWDADMAMVRSEETPNVYSITLDLTAGNEIKFRANGGWDINWGGADGAISLGGDNIAVAEEGNYTVSINLMGNTYMLAKN